MYSMVNIRKTIPRLPFIPPTDKKQINRQKSAIKSAFLLFNKGKNYRRKR